MKVSSGVTEETPPMTRKPYVLRPAGVTSESGQINAEQQPRKLVQASSRVAAQAGATMYPYTPDLPQYAVQLKNRSPYPLAKLQASRLEIDSLPMKRRGRSPARYMTQHRWRLVALCALAVSLARYRAFCLPPSLSNVAQDLSSAPGESLQGKCKYGVQGYRKTPQPVENGELVLVTGGAGK